MKKKTVVRIVSFMAAIILAIGGMYITEKSKSTTYLRVIENQYSEAMNQLGTSLNDISITLEKTQYVSSAKQISSFAAKLFSEAELAKNALSKLPAGENGLSTVYRFLSQVGNYALSVSKGVISGNEITATQRDELKMLSNTAKTVLQVINDSDVSFNNVQYWADAIEGKLESSLSSESLANSLTELEEDMSDYPTLIYDGPYSDHILEKEPLMLADASECSQTEALERAKKALGGADLRYEDMQKGKIEAYRFANDNATVTVSKKGGFVVFMRKNRAVGDNLLSYDQALSKARKFLEGLDISSMVDTYYYTDGGVCVINFAYLDGQTICYTDLIKVGVAMDTGEIMMLETAGFLTNHTERAFEIPTHTPEEAQTMVSSDLQVEKTTITLIPTDGGSEARCFEFLCRTETGEEILVYINVKTLEDEQIYILLKTDGGTLVK